MEPLHYYSFGFNGWHFESFPMWAQLPPRDRGKRTKKRPSQRNTGAHGASSVARAERKLGIRAEITRLERGAGALPRWARESRLQNLRKSL